MLFSRESQSMNDALARLCERIQVDWTESHLNVPHLTVHVQDQHEKYSIHFGMSCH